MAEACALALVGVVSALLLRELGWRGVPVFGVVCAVGIISRVLPYLSSLGGFYAELASELGVGEVASAVLKVVGISYLAGITADICRDMGESAISGAVATVGKVEVLCIAAPYFLEIVKMGVSLVG